MLAVFTSELGATFINRHIDDLLPGRTVLVTRFSNLKPSHEWQESCPVFLLDRWAISVPVRLARRVGVSEVGLRDAAVGRFLRRQGVTVVLGEFLDHFLDFVPLVGRMRLPYVLQRPRNRLERRSPQTRAWPNGISATSLRALLTRCEFHRQLLIKLGLPAEKIHVGNVWKRVFVKSDITKFDSQIVFRPVSFRVSHAR
jgi:hypothetical protein